MTPLNSNISATHKTRSILEVAESLGLSAPDLDLFGSDKAKVSMAALERLLTTTARKGKLVFTTAITPTKAGEGKTTVSIGLAQALCALGSVSVCAIRQPSLGPVFGIKGGATGGGRAVVVPVADINLHFTGDLHAIGSANNLLAAMIDNHLFHGNQLRIDPGTVTFRRAVDMNDRSLRSIVTGLGGKSNVQPAETGFDITAASEVMAILCLSESIKDLKSRLGKIVVARDLDGAPVTASSLKAQGAMALLLKDAIRPNLVQTLEGTPAFVHGGPFANIAHGCSSLVATNLALRVADFVVTEGGFGADLGFEKFLDIVAAPRTDLTPDAVVLVATVRALKSHGGVSFDSLDKPNVESLKAGLPNLIRHVQIIQRFGFPLVVAINCFSQDTEEEIAAIETCCRENRWQVARCDVFECGTKGGLDLAEAVRDACRQARDFKPAYEQSDHIEQKLAKLSRKVYGASSIEISSNAKKQLDWLENNGFATLPVCVAKTQYSLSDDPSLVGAPQNFRMTVKDFHLSAGAGFVVALMGSISTMPGLPKHPAALKMDVDDAGNPLNCFT